MYERFTPNARNVLRLADDKAQSTNHPDVGTGHLLLALISDKSSLIGCTLEHMGIDLEVLCNQLENDLANLRDIFINFFDRPLGFSPTAAKVLAQVSYQAEEADRYVGTEDMLLALIREEKGEAAKILCQHEVTLEKATKAVDEIYGDRPIIVASP